MNSYVCRRLVLLLDGTWNEDVEDQPASNIVYLRERLFWGLQTRRRIGAKADQEEFEKLPDDIKKKAIRAVVFDGFEYIVYYHRGVGTGPLWDRIKGGIFGSGLEQNIRLHAPAIWFKRLLPGKSHQSDPLYGFVIAFPQDRSPLHPPVSPACRDPLPLIMKQMRAHPKRADTASQ